MASLADRLRAGAHRALDKLPGKLGDVARKANEALGRPLADADELADRRAFEAETSGTGAQPAVSPPAPSTQVAPVIVYHMDKQRRDVSKLTDLLDANSVPYQVMNIQDDPAAQYAVNRDSRGKRLPVVFVAGDCIGGFADLFIAVRTGTLKKKVFG